MIYQTIVCSVMGKLALPYSLCSPVFPLPCVLVYLQFVSLCLCVCWAWPPGFTLLTVQLVHLQLIP